MIYSENGPMRVGIGGPVGSGKTALMEKLCLTFRDDYNICAIINHKIAASQFETGIAIISEII